MLGTIRRAFAFLPAAARRRWAALVPIALLAAAAEAVGAAGLFALIKIVGDPGLAATLPVVSTVYAFLPWREPRGVVLTFTVLLALFFLAKNALLGLQAYLGSKRVAEGVGELSERLLAVYLRAPYTFHLKRNSAELIRNVSHAVEVVFRSVLAPTIALAVEAFVVVAIVGVLLAAAPLVTFAVVTLVAGAGGILVTAMRRLFRSWGARLLALDRDILKSLQQTLHAVKEIKVLGRERFFYGVFARRQAALERLRHLYTTASTVPRLVVETVFVAGAFVLIALVVLLGQAGPDVVPLLGLYAYAGFRAVPSANRIMLYLNEIRSGTAAVNRLHADLAAAAAEPADDLDAADETRLPFDDRLVLDGVSYTYDGAEAPALRDVSLAVRRGESVGVVGPTGAGKSTLVDVLIGLLPPSTGRILVDGRDLATHRRAWQRSLGYVPQAIVLIDDTIRRNVALGIPDQRIDEARVRDALATAQLEGFVAALPAGLDTVVGERGVRLSGGERQRVGIARALYHAPDVLVFDEATSALDNRTETDLFAAVAALPARPTLVAVAHRSSSLRTWDRLLFVADGRIAATGSFDALMRESVEFRRMAAE